LKVAGLAMIAWIRLKEEIWLELKDELEKD